MPADVQMLSPIPNKDGPPTQFLNSLLLAVRGSASHGLIDRMTASCNIEGRDQYL